MESTFRKSFSVLLGLLAAPALAQQGSYFVLGGGGMPLAIERLDPVLSPGVTPSQHVHSLVGANAIQATMDFATTQTATCSTIDVIADKSNYWMPILYFHDPNNGSFIRVPEQPYHKIYYKYGNGENEYDTDIQEFPQEFRMITGSAIWRQEYSDAMGPYGTEMGWYCHGNGTAGFPDFQTTGFPKGFTACPNGFAAAITFPSCWNGNDLDVSNPSAHMAFPVADGITGCPEGFRVARFPQIFIEYWLNVNSFDGLYTADDQPFVLAMGDETGYAYHADFINGWEVGVLNATMKTCRPGNTGVPPLSDSTCFGPYGGTYTSEQMAACTIEPVVNEDVGWTYGTTDNDGSLTYGGVLAQLPGCQTLTSGPDNATLVTCGPN